VDAARVAPKRQTQVAQLWARVPCALSDLTEEALDAIKTSYIAWHIDFFGAIDPEKAAIIRAITITELQDHDRRQRRNPALRPIFTAAASAYAVKAQTFVDRGRCPYRLQTRPLTRSRQVRRAPRRSGTRRARAPARLDDPDEPEELSAGLPRGGSA
jgi:hypothetical protein